jgi:hypothetical protein
MEAVEIPRQSELGVARACAGAAGARRQGNEIAIDFSGWSPCACAGAGYAWWATEISIDSSG